MKDDPKDSKVKVKGGTIERVRVGGLNFGLIGSGGPRSGTHAMMSELTSLLVLRINRMKMGWARATLPNIISYDFVNSTTSDMIIALNEPSLRFG